MDIDKILKVLRNERECIARQSRPLGEMPQCRKDEDGVKLCEYCDLCLPDHEILEVYDFLIKGYELLNDKGADEYVVRCKEKLSDEEKAELLNLIKKAPITTGTFEGDIEVEPIPLPEGLVAVFEDELDQHLNSKRLHDLDPDLWKETGRDR